MRQCSPVLVHQVWPKLAKMMTTVLSHVEGAGSLAASRQVQSLSSSSLRRPCVADHDSSQHSGTVPFALPDDTLLDLFCHRVVQKYQDGWSGAGASETPQLAFFQLCASVTGSRPGSPRLDALGEQSRSSSLQLYGGLSLRR